MTTEFMAKYQQLCRTMLEAPVIHTGTWQSTDTTASPLHATHEIQDELFLMPILASPSQLQAEMPAVNLPWAENHFLERVGGVPVNPPPSHTQWPWARHNARFQEEGQGPFSHSYPERMWAKHAGECHGPYGWSPAGLDGEHGSMVALDQYGHDGEHQVCRGRQGIRFRYGDLGDLVHLLIREPLTRQAYLPIFFPEDTGNHANVRVPCTLGYHFMIRDNRLSCRYFMRSCDLVRHFPDDVYMAARLTQWIIATITAVKWQSKEQLEPGHLRMHMTSLHAFVGDEYLMKKIIGRDPVHDRIGGSSVPS